MAVDLKRGALYHHIGNKEALLFEISRVQVEAMIEKATATIESDLRPAEQFRVIARDLVQNIVEHRAKWTVFYRDFHALTGERFDAVMALRERFESLIRDVIEAGSAAGEFRAVDAVVTKGVLGMFNLTYLWLEDNGRLSPLEVADTFCDVILGGLAVPTDTDPDAARGRDGLLGAVSGGT